MSVNATITVYLQALGGKFLGPHAYMPGDITVGLFYAGADIPFSYALSSTSNDGIISGDFTVGASSFMPILTMQPGGGNPAVNYLATDANTISGQGQVVLSGYQEVSTLLISVPQPGGLLSINQSITLKQEQTAYSFIIIVPGLLLTPGPELLAGTVSVFVSMMCGCKITVNTPTSFWPPSDFIVSAEVCYSDGSTQVYPMNFDVTTNNSLFCAEVANRASVTQVNFTARQTSTGNYGYLSVIQGQ